MVKEGTATVALLCRVKVKTRTTVRVSQVDNTVARNIVIRSHCMHSVQ